MERNPPRHTAARRKAARALGRCAAVALAAALLPLAGTSCPARAGGEWSIGVARIDFRDERIGALYGSPIAPSIAVRIWTVRTWALSGGLAYATGSHRADAVAYTTGGTTRMHFLPVHLQISLERPLASGWALSGGPRLSCAWYREEWRAAVSAADLDVQHHATGVWLAIGGQAAIRARLGSVGALRASYEWLWASAARRAVPGNDAQTNAMKGGWSAFRLAWQPPWPR